MTLDRSPRLPLHHHLHDPHQPSCAFCVQVQAVDAVADVDPFVRVVLVPSRRRPDDVAEPLGDFNQVLGLDGVVPLKSGDIPEESEAVLYLWVSTVRQMNTAIDIDEGGNSIATQCEVVALRIPVEEVAVLRRQVVDSLQPVAEAREIVTRLHQAARHAGGGSLRSRSDVKPVEEGEIAAGRAVSVEAAVGSGDVSLGPVVSAKTPPERNSEGVCSNKMSMVGTTGLEPAISCSQSRRASHYATSRVPF